MISNPQLFLSLELDIIKKHMTIFTLPHELIKEKELVIIPRRELEALLRLAKKNTSEIEMTAFEKKILLNARKNKKAGKYLTLNELKNKLGIAN